jgi:hypothetical protein
MIAAAGHPIQRGNVRRNIEIFARAWSVLVFVHIKTASQVKIEVRDGMKQSCCSRCFSSKEIAM